MDVDVVFGGKGDVDLPVDGGVGGWCMSGSSAGAREMQRISVTTRGRIEMVDVTARVREAVRASGVTSGLVHLHCPHTTGTLVVNENADPDVPRDILATFERLVPRRGDYRHAEGNSQAHVLASFAGCGVTLPVEGGELVLGRWQAVFFVEMDGPRNREVWVTVIGGTTG